MKLYAAYGAELYGQRVASSINNCRVLECVQETSGRVGLVVGRKLVEECNRVEGHHHPQHHIMKDIIIMRKHVLDLILRLCQSAIVSFYTTK